jgi:Chromosome segregation ATPases
MSYDGIGMFHKQLDLAKSSPVQDLGVVSCTTANSIQKIPSSTTFHSDKYGTGSFFSSFLNSERGKKVKAKHYVPTPQINIQAIIKKKADMYYDPSLAGSFDEVLESGYTLVLNRKNQKKQLKEEEEELNEQISEIEREILPEMNRYFNLRDELHSHKTQQESFLEQVEKVTKDIEKTHEMIEDRKKEIEQLNEGFIQKIKGLQEEIEILKSSIHSNKERHQQEIAILKAEIKNKKEEKMAVKEELAKLKSDYEKLKESQQDKKRKIENKARMFLGILKH